MTAARFQKWQREQQRVDEFVTYDGANQLARRIQAFWNERDGFGWVKCSVEKITGVTHDGTHSYPGTTGAYAIRSNMVYLSGGRGPVEDKPGD